ncbi:hypothetical protein AB0D90_03540 [Streptomyces althioticus]|uniref:hypothetical protein n=1 Tax=Streptomyces althioticus TaxID=83380 RepID=UPI0033E391F0
MTITVPLVVPDEAREHWARSDRQKAWIPAIRAGRLELKGNAPDRAWRSDIECAATASSDSRTWAAAAILGANNIRASYGGSPHAYLLAPHVQTFSCRITSLDPGPHALVFETVGVVLPDSIDAAAPVILDAARAALTTCHDRTDLRHAYPGDRSTRRATTDQPCDECPDWLARLGH